MSSAKETPRQKMIGMMYLVLTCLLALNVSKEVLEGFVTINESIESTNANFTANTKLMMEALSDAVNGGRNEVKPYYEKSKEVVALSQKTFEYVDELKKEVKQYTENVKGADTMRLSAIERLDDFDKPTFLLIGSDETKPKTGKHSAKELRENIESYSKTLSVMIDEMKDEPGFILPEKDYLLLKDKLKQFLPNDNYKNKEGKPVSWEHRNFYNMPLAAVITNLSKIQSDIRSIESGMVSTFASAPGKLTIPLNQYTARIVPVSQYVQAGTPYTAEVFLTATSTHFSEENMQFILGDVDTITGKLAEDSEILPIENGICKLSIPTGAAGHKEVNGWIKLKDGTGNYKYYKYDNEFVVANSAVAVSADKMNVMYAGVENPISISAAGVAPTDLVVTIQGAGASLINKGNGKYTAKVAGTGSCVVTVLAKTPTGLKQQGAPQVFRVKTFPNPPLRIGGRSTYGGLDLPVSSVKIMGAIGVDNSSFDFAAPFKIIEFTMNVATAKGLSPDYKCTGSSISTAARAELSKLKPGNKIYFENIKVQAPDGIRTFPYIKVTVK